MIEIQTLNSTPTKWKKIHNFNYYLIRVWQIFFFSSTDVS